MTGPSYTVKNIEAIAEGSDMRARLYTLAPGDVIPWHYHTAVTDWYFCLVGILRVETRAPRGDERLAAGAHYQIPPKTAHRISNGGGEGCGGLQPIYLLFAAKGLIAVQTPQISSPVG